MTKRALILLLSLIAFLFLVPKVEGSEPVVRFFFFYAQDCVHCQRVEEEVLSPLAQKYGDRIEIRSFDIGLAENYEALLRLEEKYQISALEIPIIFIGDQALVGEKEIRARLEGLIEGYLAAGGREFPSSDLPMAPPQVTASPTMEATPCPEEGGVCPLPSGPPYPVALAYFYQAGCAQCDRVAYDLAYLQKRYPNLEVKSFDIREAASLNEALCEKYQVPAQGRLVAPTIFIGQDYLQGEEINLENLEALVQRYSQEKSEAPWTGVEGLGAEASIIERFRSFTPLTVLGAGLVDGLNPCAFATIIFFVSYLTFVGRRGREILLVGASFTLAVFLTYLLVGLGLLKFLQTLAIMEVLSRLVYLFTALLCLALAGLSLYDFIKIRRGQMEAMSLRLPSFLQRRVHAVIRESTNLRGYLGASFLAGSLVSLLELACTGQVYLPTIIFVAGVPGMRANAVLYLVLYNLMFIVPLVVVFILTFYGTTSFQLSRFLRTQAATVKLLTALIFLLLGGWLLLFLI